MKTKHRNEYLGFKTDPNENQKFRFTMAAGLIIIGIAVGIMITQETFIPKRTARNGSRARREINVIGV